MATPVGGIDVETQVRTLREGCGLLDRSAVGRLELTGPDRQRFLHGLVTCDVKGLAPGTGAYGFFTTIKGRILADVVVLALADRLRLELPPGSEEEITAHLAKYKIADRVEWAPPAAVPLTLAGPRAAELLGLLVAAGGSGPVGDGEAGSDRVAGDSGVAPPETPWSYVHTRVLGSEVDLVRQGLLGVDAFSLWVAADDAESLTAKLLAAGGSAGLTPVGPEAADVVRTEAGIPRFGRDFGPDHFPQETGLDETAAAVSYTKGCFLGQEIVARIHYRGGVNRLLRGLLFDTAPPPGTPLLFEGREAGTATTVVHSPTLARPIGLAILHQRAAAPGTLLNLETGGHAEVRPLPLL